MLVPLTHAASYHLEEKIMGIVIWLVMGGLVGWIASMIMGTNAQQGIILNVVVGIVGALIGGWLIGPMLGAGSINEGITIMSFIVSLIGAIILLALVNLFQRRTKH
ncbi:GlsB/YeaQ/YmgE family stress response membrane protein [Nitrincola sp. A-D6]|uniref:GlsB/YeaQ/YmgE family stress response membrane protein n=1 Tax=Nitrincola sp. A-D6 TaxID=1545442 RepID=UPI001F27F2F8|nr:GlsB/YeaQ/YmgE family stress response membrane protein [Nitrincola sp. A-D6]